MTPPPTKSVGAISKETMVPIGLAVGIMATMLGGAWYLASASRDIIHAVDRNGERIETVNRKVDQVGRDRWARTEMRYWAKLLRVANPDLVIPDIDK